jgi:hypothetical protein
MENITKIDYIPHSTIEVQEKISGNTKEYIVSENSYRAIESLILQNKMYKQTEEEIKIAIKEAIEALELEDAIEDMKEARKEGREINVSTFIMKIAKKLLTGGIFSFSKKQPQTDKYKNLTKIFENYI